MKLRPLIIDENAKELISAMVVYAEANPLSMDDLLDTYNKQMNPIGDNPFHVVNLSFGYRIVYSIEEQPKGKVRHLSMSVDEDEALPSIEAVSEIMRLIGFNGSLQEPSTIIVKLEEYAKNRQAVNVLEYV